MSDGAVITPEFLRWSLDCECSLRDACASGEPEQVERQLKTLRTVAECQAAGRVDAGICFPPDLDRRATAPAPPLGFRLNDALAAYGVENLDRLPCISCPAHVEPASVEPAGAQIRWAGCYGLVDWRPVQAELFDVVDDLLVELLDRTSSEPTGATEKASSDERHDSPDLSPPLLVTRPRWRGLWATSPLEPRQLAWLGPLVARLAQRGEAWRVVFERFALALQFAASSQRTLHVEYGPAGRIVGRSWIVEPHCPVCRAPRAPTERVCRCCGSDVHGAPLRKRLGRGRRPFRPLAEFLAPAAQRDLLRRYLGTRGWSLTQIDEYLSVVVPLAPPHADV